MRCLLALVSLLGAASATGFECGSSVGVIAEPGVPCSPSYFLCPGYGKPSRKLQCPADNVFDESKKRCAPATQVPGCQPQAPPEPAHSYAPPPQRAAPPPPPPPKFQPRPAAPSQYNRPAAPQPPPPPPQAEPKFVIPETQQHYQPAPVASPPKQSNYGAPRPKPQPPAYSSSAVGFDCSNKDDGDYADGCSHLYYSCRSGQAMERTCALTALKFDSASGQCGMPDVVAECGGAKPKPQAAEPTYPEVSRDPRCEGLETGIYEMPGEPCSDKFLACNDGFATEMNCAGGAKFDVEVGRCQAKRYVAACGGYATPAPVEEEPKPRAPLDPSISCDGKPDGDYAIPYKQCADGYFSCSGGAPEERKCPDGLRFESNKGFCEAEEFNVECGGSERPIDDATTHAPFVTESEFSCKGMKDGLYDDHYQCSPTFYACSGGKPNKFTCSGGMMFDPESERCVDASFVQACGGAPTPIPEIVNDAGTPLPPPAIDFDCSKGEGHHSLGCAAEYVVCSFGRPYPRSCASPSLVFDTETESCLAAAFVRECGGYPTPKPEPPPSDFVAPPTVDFNCEDKEDGIFADDKEPCSPHFYTCSGSSAQKIPCPEDLFFNKDEEACMASEFVKACQGVPTPKPAYGQKPKASSYQPQAAPRAPPPAPKPSPYQPQAAPPPPPPPPAKMSYEYQEQAAPPPPPAPKASPYQPQAAPPAPQPPKQQAPPPPPAPKASPYQPQAAPPPPPAPKPSPYQPQAAPPPPPAPKPSPYQRQAAPPPPPPPKPQAAPPPPPAPKVDHYNKPQAAPPAPPPPAAPKMNSYQPQAAPPAPRARPPPPPPPKMAPPKFQPEAYGSR